MMWGGSARPDYDPPDSAYARGTEHDLGKYLEFMKRQVTELLTGYGPIAAIWLDGISTPLSGDYGKFRCQELYDHVHSLQPQVLVSYKQGLLGTEDFFAPEFKVACDEKTPGGSGHIAEKPDAPVEICATMIREPASWGHSEKGRHLSAEEIWDEIRTARRSSANLLLNTGPLPDGSIDERDRAALLSPGYSSRVLQNDRKWPVKKGISPICAKHPPGRDQPAVGAPANWTYPLFRGCSRRPRATDRCPGRAAVDWSPRSATRPA